MPLVEIQEASRSLGSLCIFLFPTQARFRLLSRQRIVGLKQKSSPNKPQTSFVSSKHLPIVTEPLEEAKRYGRLKRL